MRSGIKLLLLAVGAMVFVGCSGGETTSTTEPVKTDSTQVRAAQTGTNTVEANE